MVRRLGAKGFLRKSQADAKAVVREIMQVLSDTYSETVAILNVGKRFIGAGDFMEQGILPFVLQSDDEFIDFMNTFPEIKGIVSLNVEEYANNLERVFKLFKDRVIVVNFYDISLPIEDDITVVGCTGNDVYTCVENIIARLKGEAYVQGKGESKGSSNR